MNYFEQLSAQLHLAAALYGLDIQKMAALTQLESMATVSPSPSLPEVIQTLLSGLQAYGKTTNETAEYDAVVQAVLQAGGNARYASVTTMRSGRRKYTVYLKSP